MPPEWQRSLNQYGFVHNRGDCVTIPTAGDHHEAAQKGFLLNVSSRNGTIEPTLRPSNRLCPRLSKSYLSPPHRRYNKVVILAQGGYFRLNRVKSKLLPTVQRRARG